MPFSCERPYAFYGLLVLVPAVILAVRQYIRISHQMKKFAVAGQKMSESSRMTKLPLLLALRTAMRCLAWIMLVFAYAGFSWGTYEVPVRKNGRAVSFVFDISYSMNADDAPGGLSRLQASARYAGMLLSRMQGTSVSVVLAKGDGVTVVPMTEDTEIASSLLDTLSPSLMTAAGTSLGKGIEAALRSFPASSARSQTIWVFTDGDETDGQLAPALAECVKYGVNTALIGFGTEREVEVYAGDGKTRVMTALRSDKMKKAAALASDYVMKGEKSAAVRYVDATEPGSALSLLRPLSADSPEEGGQDTVSYEVRPVERYSLFLVLAVVFLAASFIITESDPFTRRRLPRKEAAGVLIILTVLPFLFTSCGSPKYSGAREILQSSWSWYQKKYRNAASGFLRAETGAKQNGDAVTAVYAEYGLAATYIMQDEYEAASERLAAIPAGASPQIRYAAYYNKGIIACHNGDYEKAASCFREALRIDGTKMDAKVNLEIARGRRTLKSARSHESQILPAAENSADADAVENAVFRRIRENDKKQWKNSESSDTTGSSSDY